MHLQLLFMVLCYAQVLSASEPRAERIPGKVINSGNACPTEEQQAETRRQITSEVFAALVGTRYNPASSCTALPASHPSGNYWIRPNTSQPAVQVYCDFDRQCGCDGPSTWTRVAFLNMSDPNQDCPDNWFSYSSPVRTCGRGVDLGGCVSVTYSTHGQNYNRVCGRVLGYQNHLTGGLFRLIMNSRSIDQIYMNGVSLTHGNEGSRQHIWSFVSAMGESSPTSENVCACSSNNPWPHSTSFIGNDYFCDSGNEGIPQEIFYYEDPLWDGAGCGPDSTCCKFNNPPWFCKTLSQPTTEDLEVRVCSGLNRDVPIELIELYIQ